MPTLAPLTFAFVGRRPACRHATVFGSLIMKLLMLLLFIMFVMFWGCCCYCCCTGTDYCSPLWAWLAAAPSVLFPWLLSLFWWTGGCTKLLLRWTSPFSSWAADGPT